MAIAYTNDWIEPEQILGASAALVTTSAIGALIGPLVTSLLMSLYGVNQYVVALTAIHAAIAVYTLFRMIVQSDVPEPRDFVSFPSRATVSAVSPAAEPHKG